MEPNYTKMEYRYLGNTDLKVSVLGGFQNEKYPNEYNFSRDLVKKCLN